MDCAFRRAEWKGLDGWEGKKKGQKRDVQGCMMICAEDEEGEHLGLGLLGLRAAPPIKGGVKEVQVDSRKTHRIGCKNQLMASSGHLRT